MTTVIKKRKIAKKPIEKFESTIKIVECSTLETLIDNLNNKISFKSLVEEFKKQLLKNKNAKLKIENVIFDFENYLDDEFNCENIEELQEYFKEDYEIYFRNFDCNLLPYTCGIAEIGNYTLKIQTNESNFLKFLLLHSCVGNAFGMLTTTFIDKDSNHTDFRKLLEEFLPADTKIHFTNPKTSNALTTYIWI